MSNKKRFHGTLRRAGTTTVSIGVMLCVLFFAMIFLEILRVYDTQYAIEIRAQRAINMTVESAMDDFARADGYNIMLNYNKTIPGTGRTVQQTLDKNLRDCLKVDSSGRCYSNGKLLYTVSYSTSPGSTTYTTGTKSSHDVAGISIPITVKITSNFGSFFGNRVFNWNFKNTYKSTNFRVDEDQRAGWIVG